MIHFGVNLRDKDGGLLLTRENYITINTKSSFGDNVTYDSDYCKRHSENCLENFDINMEYFRSLDSAKFSQELNNFLQKFNEFVEIKDLHSVDGKSGYYIMVLDKYCQMYIGTSTNIKKRIMSHWSRTMPFDRLIFVSAETSILSIDSFRALDTTRIFVALSDDIYSKEDIYINAFDQKYVLNRTAGGEMPNGLTDAISYARNRNFASEKPNSVKKDRWRFHHEQLSLRLLRRRRRGH